MGIPWEKEQEEPNSGQARGRGQGHGISGTEEPKLSPEHAFFFFLRKIKTQATVHLFLFYRTFEVNPHL